MMLPWLNPKSPDPVCPGRARLCIYKVSQVSLMLRQEQKPVIRDFPHPACLIFKVNRITIKSIQNA